jgi:hypothetical protein
VARLTSETLEEWVTEFRLQHPELGVVKILDNAFEGTVIDFGLVVVELTSSPVDTFVQRRGPASTSWFVTFTPRDQDLALDVAGVTGLAEELTTVAALVRDLEARTVALLG